MLNAQYLAYPIRPPEYVYMKDLWLRRGVGVLTWQASVAEGDEGTPRLRIRPHGHPHEEGRSERSLRCDCCFQVHITTPLPLLHPTPPPDLHRVLLSDSVSAQPKKA